MRILVTGCAGLIGSNFCTWLEDRAEIIGVDDLSGGVAVPPNVTFVRANLTDPDDQHRVAAHFPVDYVFHFAAYAAEGLSPFIRQYNYKNNLVSTSFLVSESIRHKVKRFVFTSSMAVYGASPPPFDESTSPAPVDPYGIAKYACELDLKVAHEQHGLSYCILRPHNVYGPGQNIWDPYRNVLGIWMFQALHGKPMTVYGDGTQTRAFSYVDDMLPCLWRAATDPRAHCETINIGGAKETALNEATQILARVTGHTDVVHLEGRHEVKNAWCTVQKSIDILGYVESVGLEEGLRRMWAWVQKQPPKNQVFWNEYELETGLYSFWKLKKDVDS
jgi:UDP-glucose 4-epimerase